MVKVLVVDMGKIGARGCELQAWIVQVSELLQPVNSNSRFPYPPPLQDLCKIQNRLPGRV